MKDGSLLELRHSAGAHGRDAEITVLPLLLPQLVATKSAKKSPKGCVLIFGQHVIMWIRNASWVVECNDAFGRNGMPHLKAEIWCKRAELRVEHPFEDFFDNPTAQFANVTALQDRDRKRNFHNSGFAAIPQFLLSTKARADAEKIFAPVQ